MKTKSNLGRWALLLGLVAAIISLFLFLTLEEQEVDDYTSEDLFTVNFSSYPNDIFPLDKTSSKPTLEQVAFSLYDQNKFPEALLAFDTLILTTPQDDYRFYQSIVQLATDRNTDAILNLSQIVETPKTPFLPQAEWYLALAYLKIGADEAAKPLLEKLATQDDGFKSKRSKVILEILNTSKE